MKKNPTKKTLPQKKIIDEKLPLVPAYILMPLWFISLALPNLVYSGIKFADTLHILKWTVTGVPVAIAVLIAGVRLFLYGREKLTFKIDIFGIIWGIIIAYCFSQYFWINIFSPTGFALEMTCFVTVWAFYVISVSSFPDWGLRPVIVLANLNAAINVMFAELQIRNMNNLNFLQGTFLSGLQDLRDLILPTPGNYIGNTAQQNMFGLWVAVATLGAVYLFAYDAWKTDPNERGKKIYLPALSVALGVIFIKFAVTNESILLAILGVLCIIAAFVIVWRLKSKGHVYFSVFIEILACINFWGLMNSTSRSATLALLGGLILIALISLCKFNRDYVARFAVIIGVLCVVFWASMYSPRSGQIVGKTVDIVKNAENIGNRRGIWTTSAAMYLEHPEGVGIGQYKWHYMEGQRYGFTRFPYDWYTWQYTHWAHNEFLQFFCEGGTVGGVMLILMWLCWFVPAVYGLFKRPRMSININAVWGFALVSLITFCAFFTRPFHRIENMVWITLAFAVCNREFFAEKFSFDFLKINALRKLAGVACVVASIAGCVYISSGIMGNYVLRQALSTQNADLQLYLLREAEKHPIVFEETQRNLGVHFMQRGEQTNNLEDLVNGFNILWGHFNREPHSEDISRLLEFAQKYQIEEVLRNIKSYFKPGTYHLVRRPQQANDGSIINALVLVGGPGEDDD